MESLLGSSLEDPSNFIPTDEHWTAYEEAIAKAKQDKSAKKTKHPRRLQLPSGDVSSILNYAESAYENEEWEELQLLTGECLQGGVDWRPELKARFALSVAYLNVPTVYQVALESIAQYPLEADAYFAMAFCKRSTYQYRHAHQWLQLGLKVAPSQKSFVLKLTEELNYLIQNEKKIYSTVLPRFSKHDFLETYPRLMNISASDELASAFGRIAEKQTIESIEYEADRSATFRSMIALFWSMGDTASYLDDHPLKTDHWEAMRPGAGSFGCLSREVFTKIMYYCPSASIVSLHRSCSLLREWNDHPDVWANSYRRLIGPNLNVCTIPKSVWKLCVIQLNYALDTCFEAGEYISKNENGVDGGAVLNQFNMFFNDSILRTFREIIHQCHMPIALEYYLPHGNLLPIVLDQITFDSSRRTAVFYWANCPIAWVLSMMLKPSPELVPTCAEALKVLKVLVLKVGRDAVYLSHSRLGIYNQARCLLGTELHFDACALISAMDSAEYFESYNLATVMPASLRFMTLNPAHQDLFPTRYTGLWHLHFSYQHADMNGYSEKGVAQLTFDWTRDKLSGDGVDTLGGRFRFKLHSESSITSDGEAPIRFTLRYADGTRLRCIGTCGTLGFGGAFFIDKSQVDAHQGPKIVELADNDDADDTLSFIPDDDEDMEQEDWLAVTDVSTFTGFFTMIKETGPSDVAPHPAIQDLYAQKKLEKEQWQQQKDDEEKKADEETETSVNATVEDASDKTKEDGNKPKKQDPSSEDITEAELEELRKISTSMAKVPKSRMQSEFKRIEQLSEERKKWPVQDTSELVVGNGSEQERAIHMIRYFWQVAYPLKYSSATTRSLKQLIGHFSIDLNTLWSTPMMIGLRDQIGLVQGPEESDYKFKLRVAVHTFLVACALDVRSTLLAANLDEIDEDIVILRDEQHPQHKAVHLKWLHRSVPCGPEALGQPLHMASSLLAVKQAILNSQAAQEGNEDPNNSSQPNSNHDLFAASIKRRRGRGNEGISTTTAIIVGTISACIVVAGAFFIGRLFGSRSRKN